MTEEDFQEFMNLLSKQDKIQPISKIHDLLMKLSRSYKQYRKEINEIQMKEKYGDS